MKFDVKQASKASNARKLPKNYDRHLDKLYLKELNTYIDSVNFQILLYASWGVFWTPIPIHFEPKIFNDARSHFESLGFKYRNDSGVDRLYVDAKSSETYCSKRESWLITWHNF